MKRVVAATIVAWAVPFAIAMSSDVAHYTNHPGCQGYECEEGFQRLAFFFRYGWIALAALVAVVVFQVAVFVRRPAAHRELREAAGHDEVKVDIDESRRRSR